MRLNDIGLIIVLAFAVSSVSAANLYVSPSGNDNGDGGKSKPFATLAAARDAARLVAGKESVTVHVADGVYYLPETLILTTADSGTEATPVVYKANNEGGSVLSGGSKLDLKWKTHKRGIFKSSTPTGLVIDQLFVNGESQRMARYPNFDASQTTVAFQGCSADAFSKERAARWDDPTGGYIHAMHDKRWGGYHYLITGKDASGQVTYEGGWQNNRQMGMHKSFRMVENIYEELDAPGEWFHDAKTSTLYYMPEAGVDLAKATVEVVRLRHLIEFQGSMDKPVKHISFDGFVVRHAARTFMDTKEPMLRSDWTIYRGGAFLLTGTEDVSIIDCEFDQVGGNAIFVNNYNRNTLVKGCHIHDAGASGVCFVGDPNAVRNPLFEYSQKNNVADIDRTPGPKTENYPALGTVEDCLIHGIGRIERQPAGVQIEMASEITVRDCSIYDCARSGINVGDGCWGGHLIERCDVFNTVLETHDHGSFNSWGRDRFWRTTPALDWTKEKKFPFLDAMKTTTIRDSRWRCDHGWDIDLDDGSTNYDIYNNVLLSGGLKLREGFRRRAWNNIMINNTFHPHVWYNVSQDEVFSNIMMAKYRGVSVPHKLRKGKRIDSNLIFMGELTQEHDWDVNSIVADPQFVDPAKGDYRVKEGSPAFGIGFKNFPMDQFGVKKNSLKKIAKTPTIPKLGNIPVDARGIARAKKALAALKNMDWLGATLHPLVGEEYSAYGVSKADGGLALIKASSRSAAAKSGLLEGDLIQKVNRRPVADSGQFKSVLVKEGSKPLTLTVIREQQEIEIIINNHSSK